jgi:hypothetical protein
MTSAFEKYHPQRGAHSIVSAARFRRPNTLESTTFPDLGGIPGQPSQTPQCCSLASFVLLPKIVFDPLTHGPVHLTQAPYPLQSKLALSNS